MTEGQRDYGRDLSSNLSYAMFDSFALRDKA